MLWHGVITALVIDAAADDDDDDDNDNDNADDNDDGVYYGVCMATP